MVHAKIEGQLRKKGFTLIAGVDEAGRGPLAGPVFAAAVILPKRHGIKGLNDSKKLSRLKREQLFDAIIEKAISAGIGSADEGEIERLNILNASFLAMRRAVSRLKASPDHIIVDGNRKIPDILVRQKTVIKGDSISASVAAASILAKVSRDRFMEKLHKEYPEYGFSRHKGYGTKLHYEALRNYGPCPVHRKSFLHDAKKYLDLQPYAVLECSNDARKCKEQHQQNNEKDPCVAR